MNLLNNIITSLPKDEPKKVEQIKEEVFSGFECPDPKLNDRYRLINAFANLEFKNSKQRVMTVKKIVEEINMPLEEVNNLFIQYASETANKVVKPNFLPNGKVNHYKNLLEYVGERHSEQDNKEAGGGELVSDKINSNQYERNTGPTLFA